MVYASRAGENKSLEAAKVGNWVVLHPKALLREKTVPTGEHSRRSVSYRQPGFS